MVNTVIGDELGRFLETLSLGEDITGGKSDAQHRLLLDLLAANSAEFIGLCDVELRRFYVNTAGLRIVGFDDLETARKHKIQDACFFEDQPFITEEFRRRVTHEDLGEMVIRLRHFKTGATIWMCGSIFNIRNADGATVGWAAAGHDVTMMKQAEAALRETEQNFRLFIEQVPAAVAMFDQHMCYLAASQRWFTDYGLGERTIVGCSHYEVFPEIPERWKEVHRRCLAGAIETCEEDRFVRADGRLDWVCWTVHPWRTSDGKIGGVMIFSEVITARKNAEDALRESEQRFREIAENISDVFWIASPDGLTTEYVNPMYEAIWGRSCESLRANPRSRLEAVHPDDQARVRGAPERHGIEASGGEYRVVRPDGTIRWVHDRRFPVRDATGKVIRIVGVAHDITDRRQAEAASRVRERLLSESQRIAHIGSWSGDLAGSIEWSDETYRIYGVSPGTFSPDAASFIGLIHPDDRTAMQAWLESCWAGQKPGELEFRSITPEGTIRFLNGRGELIYDGLKRPLRLAGTVQDITDHKQTELAFAENQRRLTTLVRNLPGVAYRCRNDRDWTCEFVSEGMHRLTGFPASDFMENVRHVGQLIHPDDRDRVWDEIQAALGDRGHYELTYRITTATGEEKWVWERGCGVFDAGGSLVALEGFSTDVTEHLRSTEAVRVSRDRLAILSRQLIRIQEIERQHLARELHDELGQSLTAIHLAVQRLRDTCGEPARPRLDECAGIVDDAIRKTREVSLNLRPAILDDFGLIPALKWYIDQVRSRTDLEFILDSQGSELEFSWEQRNACFRVAQEAITNVLRHARARHVWMELRSSHDEFLLVVRDDGRGCSTDEVQRARLEGLGVGVLGMRERVELLGGRFEFHSEPGKGTMVRAWIPVSSEGVGTQEPKSVGATGEMDRT